MSRYVWSVKARSINEEYNEELMVQFDGVLYSSLKKARRLAETIIRRDGVNPGLVTKTDYKWNKYYRIEDEPKSTLYLLTIERHRIY